MCTLSWYQRCKTAASRYKFYSLCNWAVCEKADIPAANADHNVGRRTEFVVAQVRSYELILLPVFLYYSFVPNHPLEFKLSEISTPSPLLHVRQILHRKLKWRLYCLWYLIHREPRIEWYMLALQHFTATQQQSMTDWLTACFISHERPCPWCAEASKSWSENVLVVDLRLMKRKLGLCIIPIWFPQL